MNDLHGEAFQKPNGFYIGETEMRLMAFAVADTAELIRKAMRDWEHANDARRTAAKGELAD